MAFTRWLLLPKKTAIIFKSQTILIRV